MSGPDEERQRQAESDAARDRTYAAQLIACCNASMKMMRVHKRDNEAVLKLVHALQQSLEMLKEHYAPRVALAYVEGVYYLGDNRLRLSPAQEPIAEQLAREFGRRGLGGFSFEGTPSEAELMDFFSVLDNHREGQNVAALRNELRVKGVTHITVSKVMRPITDVKGEGGKKENLHRAADVFSMAIRHMAASLRDKGASSNARGKRIVHEFVDLADKDPLMLLGLAGLRGTGSDESEHSVAVSALSIALGMRIGLNRNLLADLGFAALQHDAALIELGPAHTNDTARHPLRALRALTPANLDLRQLRQIVSSFEHHRDYVGGGEPRIMGAPRPHLFSLIIRIANDFDGATRGRRGANPCEVPEAVARLYRGRGNAYHPQLVDLFVDMIGGVELAPPPAPVSTRNAGLDLMLADFLDKKEEVEDVIRASAKAPPPAKKNAIGMLKLKKLAKKKN
ncbi:MAG: hypothetical protein EXR75_02655 [Myxococcales bacterium]|nr:hypothetical protein [Myxococcales bacterium]